AAKSIVLIGMMGAGKSSAGRCLQRRTGLGRIDIDETVATEAGMPIPQIFEQCGEEKFRDAETEALRKLAPDRPVIIVTGGGIVLRSENVDLLKQLRTVFWLQADEEALVDLTRGIGVESCRIAACSLPAHAKEFGDWLKEGAHGEMNYMARGAEKRRDPQKILPGAKSIIVLAMNYFRGGQDRRSETAA